MTLIRRLQHWTKRLFVPDRLLRQKYEAFKELLRHDKRCLELITDLEEIRYKGAVTDWTAVTRLVAALDWSIGSLIRSLSSMNPGVYRDLEQRHGQLAEALAATLPVPDVPCDPPFTLSMLEAAGQADLAGGKASALGQVLRAGDLPQPRGFVITTRAFNLFLNHNTLRHRLDELLAEVRLDESSTRLQELSAELTEMISKAEVPVELIEAIAERLAELHGQGCSGPWALRSSAVGEDGENSFAGQYASIMAVAERDIAESYKKVLAGKYAPHAIAYRVRCGLADQETAMAVIVMEMIEARMSGVMYSRDEMFSEAAADCLAIYGVAGLGGRLVDGSAEPEVVRFTREPHRQERIPAGPADVSMSRSPSHLTGATAAKLADWGMRLEELFGSPQDIEWCEDWQGNCYILQSRALPGQKRTPEEEGETATDEDLPGTILLSGGVAASSGIGSGRVCIVTNQTKLKDVPFGSVLVTPTLAPSLAEILERLRAVVAEGGSRASHFASVARLHGLPVVVGLHGAALHLTEGSVVTVDGRRGLVCRGTGKPQATARLEAESGQKTPFMTRLIRLMDLISPLHLLDPISPEFSPQYCRSFHDLVRYAHEKGIAEMFSLVDPSGREMARAKQLTGDLPLIMHVLDLGDGLTPESAERKVVHPEQIASPLMRACWAGLSDPSVNWHEGLPCLDWEQADRQSGGIFSLKSAAFGSYAVVAREYLHLVLRFGYHFAVLDALGGDEAEANYIAFRFKGGGGNYQNRLWRIKLIDSILSWAGFSVSLRGDLLDARLQHRPIADIINRLTLLGILQGKCRLLDMALTDASQIDDMAVSLKEILQRYVDTPSLSLTGNNKQKK